MRVFITGGSGFVGEALCRAFLDKGCRVEVLTRSEKSAARLLPGVEGVVGDPLREGPWMERAAGAGILVNLAGASIFGRWSEEYKKAILDSRVLTTRNLVQALARREGGDSPVLVSTSAVGYYGFRGDEELDENGPPGDDFLARVCRDWEAEAMKAAGAGARVIVTRFGIVMGDGGALGQMLPFFRRGVGGPLGSGSQWLSWIHRLDLVRAILFLSDKPDARGPYNLTAPHPVTNREMAGDLGRALHRPAFLPVPGFAVRLTMGELASVLLNGQRVLPRRLLEAGFQFRYPDLPAALAEVLGGK